jgi:hypothetical protein
LVSLRRTILTVVLASATAAITAQPQRPIARELVGGSWDTYFPFRLGDSWTYDWRAEGPLAPAGVAVRTRAFDGTSFVGDQVGYKLVSDDGAYHLYTFERGALAIHSSSEAGHLLYYEPPVLVASPDLRVGEPLVTTQSDGSRTFKTTVLGLEDVTVPLGTFARSLAVRIEMEGQDYSSETVNYFAARVGLVAYRYMLRDPATNRELLRVDARLRLARLSGINIVRGEDVARLSAPNREVVGPEDRHVREMVRKALARRYTWDSSFPGFAGEAELVRDGSERHHGRFTVRPDLNMVVEAGTSLGRAVLGHEISSFITQRKPQSFDVTYGETTFVRRAIRPHDGAHVIAAVGDALSTTYAVKDGELIEVSRSVGRVSYIARDRRKISTADGRTLAVEYDVIYVSNETGDQIAVERTSDTYIELAGYWVPTGRQVERRSPGQPLEKRQLVLSDVRLP